MGRRYLCPDSSGAVNTSSPRETVYSHWTPFFQLPAVFPSRSSTRPLQKLSRPVEYQLKSGN